MGGAEDKIGRGRDSAGAGTVMPTRGKPETEVATAGKDNGTDDAAVAAIVVTDVIVEDIEERV